VDAALRPDELRGERVHPAAFRKWRDDIGFRGGIYRIKFDLLTWKPGAFPSPKDRIILDAYEKMIGDVERGGGIPLLAFTSVPYAISSNPQRQGRPTWPPREGALWRRYVADVVRYFSVEKGFESIRYHVWSEPNTSRWENEYQKRLYGRRFPGMHVTKFWKGTREEFFHLYRESVRAVESVEREHGVRLRIGGVNVQVLDRWDRGDPKSFPESFVAFCREEGLRLDFFSYRLVTENAREWTRHFRALLDRNGFDDTELVVVDWTTGRGISGKNALGRTIRGVERDSEIQAAWIPAFIARLEEAGADRQGMETMQDWDVERLHGYPLFRGGLGSAFTVGGLIKPAFNTLRMLSMVGPDGVAAETSGDPLFGAVATRSGRETAVLIWYAADPRKLPKTNVERARRRMPPREVRVTVTGLDGLAPLRCRRYVVDGEHANSYRVRERILRAVREALPEGMRSGRAGGAWKNLSAVQLAAVRRSVDGINGWREINLAPVEENEREPSSGGLEFSFRMEPFSVVLIVLGPE
jgi:hypothetical protein